MQFFTLDLFRLRFLRPTTISVVVYRIFSFQEYLVQQKVSKTIKYHNVLLLTHDVCSDERWIG
jgi:hypothetical protein